MKSIYFLILSVFWLLSGPAFAHNESHPAPQPGGPQLTTPDEVCSTQLADLCAHVHFVKTPDSIEESAFIFHVETPNSEDIENLTLDLWMEMGSGHGHGSAPVVLEKVAKNKFKVSNAWFVMMGAWQIRSSFSINQISYKIIIPVNIYK